MRRSISVLVLAFVVLCMAHVADARKDVIKEAGQPQFLFVVQAATGVYENGILTLAGATGVVYFSDRPQRLAGHMPLAEFVDQWAEGTDSFAADPPNAAFSMLAEESEVVVLELLSASLEEDGGLRMEARVLEGDMPSAFAASSLFIDPVQVTYPGVY